MTVLTLQGTCTGLYGASKGCNLNIAQYLLDHGADVNQPCDVSNVYLRNNNNIVNFTDHYHLIGQSTNIQIKTFLISM